MMDPATSAQLLYSTVNLDEKQAELKSQIKKFRRRRKKTDKDRSQALTETSDEFDDECDEDDDEEEKTNSKKLMWTAGTIGTAMSTIGMNVLAAVLYRGPIAMVSCAIATLTAGTVAVHEPSMQDVNSFRGFQDCLRMLVNELVADNVELSTKVEELKIRVFCLSEAEERLKEITKDQSLNVRNLVTLVQESKRITEEKNKILRQDIVADVMEVVLKCDKDESGDFDNKEVRRLLQYMRGLPRITVNERKLKLALKKDRSLIAMFDLVNDISREDIPDKHRIFIIDDEPGNKSHPSETETSKSKQKTSISKKKAGSRKEDIKSPGSTSPKKKKKVVTGDEDTSETKSPKPKASKKKKKKKTDEEDDSLRSSKLKSPKEKSKKKKIEAAIPGLPVL